VVRFVRVASLPSHSLYSSEGPAGASGLAQK
jgi:hypothetical protein